MSRSSVPTAPASRRCCRWPRRLLTPSAGTVKYGEHDAHATPALRQRIGLVGHDLYLYPELTAAENLLFYGRLHRVPDVVRRVDVALERAHLTPRRDDPCWAFRAGCGNA